MDKRGGRHEKTIIESFEERYKGQRGIFQTIGQDDGPGGAKSIEGYILIVTGVHEEAQEDNFMDLFSRFGPLKNLHINLDRKSGYVKGYALVEYETYEQAEQAIKELDGEDLLGLEIKVDWVFKKEKKH
jgi:RNA-binding protein 8A